ncbi:hypothetical protein J2X84_002264 [Pseudomonas corrugata]|uniref:hypothetical protein n=1 Tax=Pseudomonas corrugata TaxID=47879 RepID=UPI00285D68AE|nr:hypothetical protein [Pseudomonas corrugata]MDR7283440.1 hypothetical protein [Pseudomonas corrugata]
MLIKIIVKRFLNLVAIIATVRLLLVVGLGMVAAFASENYDWIGYISANLDWLIYPYIIILSANYLVFGKVTIWHKNISHKDSL